MLNSNLNTLKQSYCRSTGNWLVWHEVMLTVCRPFRVCTKWF